MIGVDGSKRKTTWEQLAAGHFPGRSKQALTHYWGYNIRDPPYVYSRSRSDRRWVAAQRDDASSDESDSDGSDSDSASSVSSGVEDHDSTEVGNLPDRRRAAKGASRFTPEEDALILQFLDPSVRQKMKVSKFTAAYFEGRRTGEELTKRLKKLLQAKGGSLSVASGSQVNRQSLASSDADSGFEDDARPTKKPRRSSGLASLPSSPQEDPLGPTPSSTTLDADPGATLLLQFKKFTAAFSQQQTQLQADAYTALTAELVPGTDGITQELMEKMMTAPVRWAKMKEEMDFEMETKKRELRGALLGSLDAWYSGGAE